MLLVLLLCLVQDYNRNSEFVGVWEAKAHPQGFKYVVIVDTNLRTRWAGTGGMNYRGQICWDEDKQNYVETYMNISHQPMEWVVDSFGTLHVGLDANYFWTLHK